ncbi:glucosyltransferase domain-containing protein [Pantoea stewartii]|uniref:glucosyltransferase domain-containing protein n=1 Tax=Pantoea stewartii TaxID=66269 RepID=UPI0023F7A13B|nr:glucosyltransferase domain-containing protein [Pantoea stewartii]MDF7784027.1 glucosyltransferase domain-containing protein [Pantoea stewartii]MEB6535089.1 glucosyltransferase domain-containing protein [Pantoea stewartii]
MDSFNIKKCFFISLGLCSLYSIPLFMFGGYYIDDMLRSLNGNTDWIANGRPIAEIFMKFIYFGKKMADISPIPQLIALGISSITIALLSKRYYKPSQLIGCLIFLPLFISPFYLQNISYKYDAPIMSLSVMFAVLPFIINPKGNYSLFLISSLCCLISLNFYQPALNVYLGFLAIDFFSRVINTDEKPVLSRYLFSLSAYALATIIYTKIISVIFIAGDYSISQSRTLNHDNLIEGIVSNLNSFYNLIKMSLPPMYFLLLIPAALLSAYSVVKKIAPKFKSNISYGLFISLASILAFLFSIASVAGPIILLQSPSIAPRIFLGFSSLLCLIFFCSTISELKNKNIILIALLVPVAYMYEISYAYVNSLNNQNNFERSVISNISGELGLTGSNKENPTKYIFIKGRIPKSPENILSFESYPILQFLVPRTINNSDFWSGVEIRHYGMELSHDDGLKKLTEGENICNLLPTRKGPYYNSYIYNEILIIDFDKTICR